ncbi:MAG: hypothetical protein M0Z31_01370 [Clostridia bacterium]|nr:hypothetical protein [Clostridia bacterium]
MILRSLLKNDEVIAFTDKKNKSSTLIDWEGLDPVAEINEIRSITTKNGSIIVFSSEPDIKLLNKEGEVLGGVEIKAGLDPAGALEKVFGGFVVQS